MKRKQSIPSGFEDILGGIYSNAEQGGGVTDIDSLTETDPIPPTPPVDNDKNTKEPPVKTEDGKNTDDDPNAKDDDSPIPTNIVDPEPTVNPPVNDTPKDGDPSEEDLIEAQQIGLLFDAVGQSLGWNMADIKEEDRPLTVEDLTQYLSDVVKENSVPQYADDRIQRLDEYVKNGGKFEDFYSRQQETLTLDNINLEDETNQKAVIRDLMKRSGYSDEQINRKISRYEDSDMLYEESEDALDRLKQIRQKEIEDQAAAQQEAARIQEEQSKLFFDTVSNDINALTDIRGIAIPKEDRKALFDYIFKVDSEGKSQYAKDFEKNLSKNLIESAYFTMKADALISNAEKKGESSAAEKLRKMLRHTSKNHTTFNADEKQKSVTDLLAGSF